MVGHLKTEMPRFPLAVFRAIRDNWPDEKPVSMRISAYDWVEGGTEVSDAVEIGRMLKEAGIDIVDVSSGNVTDDVRPRVEGLFQTPFSERIRNEAGIPTMTVGNVGGPQQINEVIAEGRADLCCMAKGQLYDPVLRASRRPGAGYRGLRLAEAISGGRLFQTGRLNRRFYHQQSPGDKYLELRRRRNATIEGARKVQNEEMIKRRHRDRLRSNCNRYGQTGLRVGTIAIATG